MSEYGYQKKMDANTAMARVDGIDASYRDLCNVCSNVRGRKASDAIQFLEEAFEKKRPVRYFRHNKRRGHLRELGGKKGGWPVKSVRLVLKVLQNAQANANFKGLGECRIVHVVANKQLVYGRMSPKGRRVRQDFETAFVEIVLRELNTPQNKLRQEERKKKLEEMEQEKKMEGVKEEKKAEEKKTDAKAEEKKAESPSVPKIEKENVKAETQSSSKAVVVQNEQKSPVVAEKKATNGKKKMTYKEAVKEQNEEKK